jgi:putative transposase
MWSNFVSLLKRDGSDSWKYLLDLINSLSRRLNKSSLMLTQSIAAACGAVAAHDGAGDARPQTAASQPHPERCVCPYRLRGVPITRNQVWSIDSTYIRLHAGFVSWVAVMDWFSRDVLSWAVSMTMDVGFCLEALEQALGMATPDILNSDQGSQLTSADFTGRLKTAGVKISMDGRGRALDNVFVERLWRTVKYEEVYLKDDGTPREAMQELEEFFQLYNRQRLHQALGYQTPATVYFGSYV